MNKLLQTLALIGYTLYTIFAFHILRKAIDNFDPFELIGLIGWILLSSVIIFYHILETYGTKGN